MKKTKKQTISNFIAECEKSKGWDLKETLEKGETYVECVLRQPCYYATLIEFIGEESAKGRLNLESVQDDIMPNMILELLNAVEIALQNTNN